MSAIRWARSQFDATILSQIDGVNLKSPDVCDAERVPPAFGAGTGSKCRYWCDQCQSNLFRDTARVGKALRDINNMLPSWEGSRETRPGPLPLCAKGLTKLWAFLVELCVDFAVRSGDYPNMGVVGIRNNVCSSVEGMRNSLGAVFKAIGEVAAIADCINQLWYTVNDFITIIGQATGTGYDYGYLNNYTSEMIAKPVCNALAMGGFVSEFGVVKSFFGSAAGHLTDFKNFLKTNPQMAAINLACTAGINCNRSAVCGATETACKFNTIASRPAPGFTAETNYAQDLGCCCSQAGPRNNFAGPWVIIEEHRCIDSGWSFRPGTCGPRDQAARQAMWLPTTPQQCANFHAGVDPHTQATPSPATACDSSPGPRFPSLRSTSWRAVPGAKWISGRVGAR